MTLYTWCHKSSFLHKRHSQPALGHFCPQPNGDSRGEVGVEGQSGQGFYVHHPGHVPRDHHLRSLRGEKRRFFKSQAQLKSQAHPWRRGTTHLPAPPQPVSRPASPQPGSRPGDHVLAILKTPSWLHDIKAVLWANYKSVTVTTILVQVPRSRALVSKGIPMSKIIALRSM